MGALSHIRVLDLSRVLAAPWATQILGDLGAEVIKIEKPGEGDETRRFGPPFLTQPDGSRGDATYFLTANRNKKSLTIDLSKPQGAALVRRLVRSPSVRHVQIENSAHILPRDRNRDLVAAEVTAFMDRTFGPAAVR